jgi:hypothetical protein
VFVQQIDEDTPATGYAFTVIGPLVVLTRHGVPRSA